MSEVLDNAGAVVSRACDESNLDGVNRIEDLRTGRTVALGMNSLDPCAHPARPVTVVVLSLKRQHQCAVGTSIPSCCVSCTGPLGVGKEGQQAPNLGSKIRESGAKLRRLVAGGPIAGHSALGILGGIALTAGRRALGTKVPGRECGAPQTRPNVNRDRSRAARKSINQSQSMAERDCEMRGWQVLVT